MKKRVEIYDRLQYGEPLIVVNHHPMKFDGEAFQSAQSVFYELVNGEHRIYDNPQSDFFVVASLLDPEERLQYEQQQKAGEQSAAADMQEQLDPYHRNK